MLQHTYKALAEFTQQTLNSSQQSLSLPNNEMSLMKTTVLQNWMALDIITVWKGGTCAIIGTECCCVFTPNESDKTSSLLNHMRTHVKAM